MAEPHCTCHLRQLAIQHGFDDEMIIATAKAILNNRCKQGRALYHEKDVTDYIRLELGGCDQERVYCLCLDINARVIAFELLFQGTSNDVTVFPREILKVALKHDSKAIVLVHNHPCDPAVPRPEYYALTEALRSLLEAVNVDLLYHFIVDQHGKYVASFCD